MSDLLATDLMESAKADLISLRQQDDQLRRTAEGIQASREELAERIAKAEEAIEYFSRLLPREIDMETVREVIRGVVGVARSALQEGTIGDAAAAYMQMQGGQAHVTDLVSSLQEAHRVSPNDQAAYRVIYATLDRDKRFARVSPGVFALANVAVNRVPVIAHGLTVSGNGLVITPAQPAAAGIQIEGSSISNEG